MKKDTLIAKWIDMILEKYDLSYMDQFKLIPFPEDPLFLTYQTRIWRITPETVQWLDDNNTWHNDDKTLCDIAREYFNIAKIPFKPRMNQTYFYVEWIGNHEPYTTQTTWDNALIDMYNFTFGNCFLTAEAAMKNEKTIFDKMHAEANKK